MNVPAIQLMHVCCNLCGADNSIVHLVRRDLSLAVPGLFSLVRCQICGLVYLNPRPVLHQLPSLYEGEYDQYTVALQDAGRFARADRSYGLGKRCRLVLKYQRRGRLLDVGCATGDFLESMQKYPGWDVYGVELSSSASEYARSRLGLSVHNGTLASAGFELGTFDVVTLWNVIEHLPDPLADVRTIASLLRPGGVMVVTTPNLGSLDAHAFGPYWIGYELPRHLYVFSRQSLAALAARVGFSIIQTRCLYGGHAATMSSLRYWLKSNLPLGRLREIAITCLFSFGSRVILSPYFFLTDRAQLSSGLTVVFRKED